MERQNGNMSPCKTTEREIKGKPPYSVETPYGFRIDLDFLKYVDDIEKGNTIKRVPIQRRSKGPRASTLPRHLNPAGCGFRPSPWGSTGALGPKSRLSNDQHYGYTSWAYDHRSPVSPTGLRSLAEMEARIKEFDEQPLGEHIRPHLLRASSLPLTVLLRQGSESTDELTSLRSSRDHLGTRNTSCEDVFHLLDSPRTQDCSGLVRRLTEALERVGELEMEVRVIPELRAQICILQEERQRLHLSVNPHNQPPSTNGTTHTADIKRPRHESRVMFPGSHSGNPTHEWRTSSDLDELLTVTSLQAKVAMLEQKLHETGLELQRVSGLLREQQRESSRKDKKIETLTRNPGVWVCAERVVVDQDGDETVVRSSSPDAAPTNITTNGESGQLQDWAVDSTGGNLPAPVEPAGASAEGINTALAVHHINKIKRLLDQQWKCLCSENQHEEGKPFQHPNPKVNSLQQEIIGLVNILSSHDDQTGHDDGENVQPGACSELMEMTDRSAWTTKNRFDEGHTGGNLLGLISAKKNVDGDLKHKESSISPVEMAPAQVDAEPATEGRKGTGQTSPDRTITPWGAGSGSTDGRIVSVEVNALEKMAKMKPQPSGEQMEGNSGSGSTPTDGDGVNAEFLTACQILKDQMENMENPNDDMRRALVVLFQIWFSAAAEEASAASRVAAYLKEVKRTTPSLLAFLINLADDNGNTVLHYSVSHCNYSIVSLLLDTGVSDVNLQNKAGYTSVMLASLTAPDGPGGMEVVRRLMEQGDINVRSTQSGQTALHLAVRHGRVVMVRLLLSCGADANIQDGQGTTALMFASERGNTHIARLLLERSQCDLTLTDKRGRNALSIATQSSHADTAALLQAHAKARAL